MIERQDLKSEKKYNKWIVVLSVVVPLVVALLFGVNLREMGFDVKPLTFLPPIYATINGFTAVILMIAFWAIKNKHVEAIVEKSLGNDTKFTELEQTYLDAKILFPKLK